MNAIDIRNLANHLGADLTRRTEGRFAVLLVDAPKHKIWRACMGHSLRAEWVEGDNFGKQDSINALHDRMSLGLTDCEAKECDMCNDY